MKNWLKEYFYQSLTAYPDSIAMEVANVNYSYAVLGKKVQSIINSFEKRGVKEQAIVVFNDHSIDTYAGILAINFTGNTVLPIEITWPENRLSNIIEKVGPGGIIVSSLKGQKVEAVHKLQTIAGCFCYEVETSEMVEPPKAVLPKLYKDLAYIIFTSGSTGEPKGVPVKQESINAFISYYKSEYDFNQHDRFLQVYDLTFDVAYFSFYVPLTSGSCCCVLNTQNNTPKYLSILKDLLTRNVTVVSMVPTVLFYIKKYIKGQQINSLRYSFFSGDALYHEDAVLWKSFIPNGEIHNCYGPTETTIVCTRYIWNESASALESHNGIVPIGTPFPDMVYKVIDDQNDAVENGNVGELAFSGKQVIDHYLEFSNTDRFIRETAGKKLVYYKTGDLVHVNEKGNLVFHGRKDNQVKINGYRVEIGEVELVISKLLNLRSVVVKRKSKEQLPFLKAYIQGSKTDVVSLKQKLVEYLPVYMIPAEISFVSDFPMNQNGKVDRKCLENMI